MTKDELVANIRFALNDTSESNLIQREKLTDRPGNNIDGVNKRFVLFNRRIASIDSLYDETGTEVASGTYTLTSAAKGYVDFTTAPVNPNLYVDYYWYKLTDTDIELAIRTAAAPAGFSYTETSGTLTTVTVADTDRDFATLYVTAFCYLAAASRASEFYTMSSSGKQISKSELFNHYQSMYDSCLKQAEALRTDSKKDRGMRDVPSDATATSTYVTPYIQSSSGG